MTTNLSHPRQPAPPLRSLSPRPLTDTAHPAVCVYVYASVTLPPCDRPQTERPVKETRLGPSVTVETRVTRLPDSFTALMLFAVKYSHGPPVAYVRAAAFNQLDVRLNGGPGQSRSLVGSL